MKRRGSDNVKLQCNDGAEYEIKKAVAMQSETIKNLIKKGHGSSIVHVDVTGPIMSEVIEYWNLKSTLDRASWSEIRTKQDQWHAKFKDDTNQVMELTMAANYLGCTDLIVIMRKMVEELTPDEAANYFELRF